MEVSGFKMNYRSSIALSQLSEADQAAIRAAAPLADLPPSEWPRVWSDDRTSPSRST